MIQTQRLTLLNRDKEYYERILNMDATKQMHALAAIDEHRLEIELERVNRIVNLSEDLWKSWDLQLNSEKKLIGSCGFHNILTKHSRAEIGYGINDNYRKIGLMSEAVGALIRHGFENLSFHRIEAFVSPYNIASISLLKRLEFQKEGLLRQHHFHDGILNDSEVYAILKGDYIYER